MAKNKYDIRTQDYKTQRTMAKTFAYMLIGWVNLCYEISLLQPIHHRDLEIRL